MFLIGLARLGRDCEVRYLQDGTPVANLALAYNYGKKDDQGNRPTQWVEGVLWGDRAEKLGQYLVKGQQLNVHLSDLHIETYQKNDGTQGVKLVGRVDTIEFAGSRPQQQGQPQQQASSNDYARETGRSSANTRPQPSRPAPNFSDMDDDIPF
ncbi:MAG TPA: single-stranded DNA-binding protein [Noviherbaspirillum sp.]|nr:single-stranded DNA-binding protein [Noviherbaspirillum sp.]